MKFLHSFILEFGGVMILNSIFDSTRILIIKIYKGKKMNLITFNEELIDYYNQRAKQLTAIKDKINNVEIKKSLNDLILAINSFKLSSVNYSK